MAATAMQSQAGALLVADIVMGGVLKSLAVEAAALAGAIIETFMWTPRLLAVGALLMFAADAWRAWRLHTDPVALYEER